MEHEKDLYADRLAKQAVIVSLAKQRLDRELGILEDMVRGTPQHLWPKENQARHLQTALDESKHPL